LITIKKETGLSNNSVDLINLIRSIQRLEGNPDCFCTANGHCDRLDCVWRVYCLEKSPDDPVGEKEISDEENRHNFRAGAG
jgi:hypothetical protein